METIVNLIIASHGLCASVPDERYLKRLYKAQMGKDEAKTALVV